MAIALNVQNLVFDAVDPQLLPSFWPAVLGRPVVDD